MNEDPTKQDTTLTGASPETPNVPGAPNLDASPAEPNPDTIPAEQTPEAAPVVAPTLVARPDMASGTLVSEPTPVADSVPTATQSPTTDAVGIVDAPAAGESSPPAPAAPKSKLMPKIICLVIGLIVAAAVAFGAYHFGNNHGYTKGKQAETAAVASAQLKVPAGATMVAQCAAGEGTQYVLPSNIPAGPIYNVWNGKVTGIEYMLAQSSIADSKTLNLALHSQKYNHVDVMYEASGHAGFTEPHYHIVLSLISYADEQKITCGGSSSTPAM